MYVVVIQYDVTFYKESTKSVPTCGWMDWQASRTAAKHTKRMIWIFHIKTDTDNYLFWRVITDRPQQPQNISRSRSELQAKIPMHIWSNPLTVF
jgi:hypothetical protein